LDRLREFKGSKIIGYWTYKRAFMSKAAAISLLKIIVLWFISKY
jgi:hypothetical protein